MVMAIFQTTHDVERAVAELSVNGFSEKDVALIIFSPVPAEAKGGLLGWLARGGLLGDTIDQSDGVSAMDGIATGAVIGCLLGMVWGSHWRWGPIAWATLGLMIGGIVGLILDWLIPEKRRGEADLGRGRGLMLVQVTALVADRASAARRLLEANNAQQIVVLPGSGGGSGGAGGYR